ncbi:diguanylate cyclase [Neptuniibacter sp. CAU 1671]|uniref:GGDEF domain-containing protein n=1 Tax=Neptuniibacter sp. CAU 1671 TaxID=3032593 RepID=UPI0023DCAB18|nr:diguanylate cyclase [Neptuniibacter sp. CAU 1671]MDF2182461.1 diguanylate cyclase [Neptuniibacter sp. CAU 1671]
MKLLIADDDATSRTILMMLAREWGFEPVLAEDGLAAWDAMQTDAPPTLLLLDWEMPGLNGVELCARIRSQFRDNPPYIILLTSRNRVEDVVAGLDQGANDYIAKPFENAELHARIRVGRRLLQMQEDLKIANANLAYRADHDDLTGLYNRRAIYEGIPVEQARAARQGEAFCIALCDVDFFKKVNDTYGHSAGDQVLKEVANRLCDTLRPYDLIGRYGGEEFMIVLSTSRSQICNLFERLRNQVASIPFQLENTQINVTLSTGICIVDPEQSALTVDQLVSLADEALYKAKADGRNCTMVISGNTQDQTECCTERL